MINFTERNKIPSREIGSYEREIDNPLRKIAIEVLDILDIPQGAFSGLGTYINHEGKEKRFSPKFDKIMAETFTNFRYIIREINNVGRVTSKDPREKYDGDMEYISTKLETDFKDYKETVDLIIKEIKTNKKKMFEGKKGEYKNILNFLKNGLKIYKILTQMTKLKKKASRSANVDEIDHSLINGQMELKYLQKGDIVFIVSYFHGKEWQREVGTKLSKIFKTVNSIAIERAGNISFGESIKYHWVNKHGYGYDSLVRKLVKDGFKGNFMEIDPRLVGKRYEKTFDRENLSNKQAKILFKFQEKYNQYFARKIGGWKQFKTLFENQRLKPVNRHIEDTIHQRGAKIGISQLRNGTYNRGITSIGKDLTTFAEPQGFEMGQMVFSDAMSVIKLLLLGNRNNTLPEIIVDFQGAAHTARKSYFFDHPDHAMEVILSNVHEILAHHPKVNNVTDILKLMEDMDEDVWRFIFNFIGKIPISKPKKTFLKRSTNIGPFQMPIENAKPYMAIEHLSTEKQEKLERLIKKLASIK